MKTEEIEAMIERELSNIATLDRDIVACDVRLGIFKNTMECMVTASLPTRKLEEAIEKEKCSRVEIENKVNFARARLSAYEDLAKMFPKNQNVKLREGTEIAKIEKLILAAGKPLSLDEIVCQLKESDETIKTEEDIVKKKKSLRSTLRAYVRDHKVFDQGDEADSFSLMAFRRLDGQVAEPTQN